MNTAVKIDTADTVFVDEHPGVVAAPERIMAWAELAKAGDEFVYASRCHLPIGSRGAETARDLAAREIVHLKQRRIAGRTELNYVAERSGAPWSQVRDRPRSAPREPRPISHEAAAINALLPLLERAARFNRPCPTDVQLADRAGLPVDAVQPALAAMKASGVIRIIGVKAPTLRLITIVATGHRTGMMG